MTLAFVAQFSISQNTFLHTLQPHIGKIMKPGKFAPPVQATKANIKSFIHSLYAYEATPSNALLAKLNGLIGLLDLGCVRLNENNDSIIFYPRSDLTPLTCDTVLVWNFNIKSVCFIYDPHSGQDNTVHCITNQFLNGYTKGLLCNAFNPNQSINPEYVDGAFNENNIKRFSDPSHSNTTSFIPLQQAIYDVYPNACGIISHGSVTNQNQMLMCNNYNDQFLNDGRISFTTLLAIAVAIQVSPLYTNLVAVGSNIPGFIKINGTSVPLVGFNDSNSPLVQYNGNIINQDVIGHIANGSDNAFNLGPQTDKLMYCQFNSHFTKQNSHLMDKFVKAQNMAVKWYMNYNPAIQDPWKLKDRYPEVYNDMTNYPKLFE